MYVGLFVCDCVVVYVLDCLFALLFECVSVFVCLFPLLDFLSFLM